MANQEHLDILKQGVETWNQWLDEHPGLHPDFSGADLIGAELSEAVLSRANLRGADLRMSNLEGARLRRADLSEAYLRGARLEGASFEYANLHKADLRLAELRYANLSDADLSEANLSEASLSEAVLWGADLKRANLSETYLSKTLFSGADLRLANLSRANLSETNFTKTDLRGADLSQSDLTGTCFRYATLRYANLKGANLSEADLSRADLSHADLSEANLSEAILVQTNLHKAILTNCWVYGISAWDVDVAEAEQSSLIITAPNSKEPIITVDNLEVAQFIYLLLKYEKLRDVLNSVMERGVLLLGRFNEGGLDLLQAIAAKLREMKYLPIIFDFDRPHSRNLTETVMTLVGLSRFVVVDLSGRSVANELRATVPHFKIPFVPIVEESRQKEVYSMFSDFLEDDWVLPLVIFTSRENLMELLASRVIEPAEKKHQARQKLLDELFKKA